MSTFGIFSIPETRSLLSSTNIWLFQLIVDAVSPRIEIGKAVEGLRKGTFLKESLSVVILRILDILEFMFMFFSSLSSSEDKTTVSGETFLEAEEVFFNMTSY